MSFDGILLHKLMNELEQLKTGRISKITDSGETDFVLTVRARGQNHHLMISMSSDYSRIHLAQKNYDTPSKPKSITMLLRKHIEGYFIEDIQQYQNDRIVTFVLSGYNEMRDLTKKYLICEIMGRYSNMILANSDYKILEVLKRDGISEFHRTMLPNATYQYPTTNKLNPYEPFNIQADSPKELCNQLQGISMLAAQYCFQDDHYLKHLQSILNDAPKPVIITTDKGKKDFYFQSLNYPIVQEFDSISALLENYYYESDTQAKIKSKTNDLLSFVDKQIHKNEKKLVKLDMDMATAMNAEEYQIKGELLLSYPNLKSKEKQIEVTNYYTGKKEFIELDSKYTVLENSQLYYKKYQKSKTAIHYIKEQKDLTMNEIDYFKMLQYQLKNCSLNDALEIRQELLDHHYLIQKTAGVQKKKKPNYLTYLVNDVEISVGKNNLQNEFITHHLAKPNEMWFHVQSASGSHVVVHSQELNEELIRTAANLAAYYSSLGQSSSVPVDYTQIKNIKKIPGKKPCFVTYTRQKTIYIDPDKNIIESLRLKK